MSDLVNTGGLAAGALPRLAFPVPCCLPRSRDGSASILPLSRPAQASRMLRPARLLAHLKWTLSRGSGFPDPPPASYRI